MSLRSTWRTKVGGGRAHVDWPEAEDRGQEVRRGFCRNSNETGGSRARDASRTCCMDGSALLDPWRDASLSQTESEPLKAECDDEIELCEETEMASEKTEDEEDEAEAALEEL